MNVLDLIVLAGISVWILIAVRFTFRPKKRGGCAGCSGCSGGCSGCCRR